MKVFGLICFIIGAFFLLPFVGFWLSYFGGWITSLVIGEKLVAALNLLFNTTYFTKSMIPMMAGALGWIGGFFKSISTSRK